LISEPIIFGQSAIVQMVKTQTYFHCLLYLDSVKDKIIRSVCGRFIHGMQREVENSGSKIYRVVGPCCNHGNARLVTKSRLNLNYSRKIQATNITLHPLSTYLRLALHHHGSCPQSATRQASRRSEPMPSRGQFQKQEIPLHDPSKVPAAQQAERSNLFTSNSSAVSKCSASMSSIRL
jgi:hypothetical protein